MKKALLFLVVAALAWSCGNDDENTPDVTYAVLDFESATVVAGPTAEGENLSSNDNSMEPYGPGLGGYDPEFPNYASYTDAATGLTVGLNVDEGAEAWNTNKPEFYAGGIAPSRWHDMETEGYPNQCSVYAAGGHNGSATFGIVSASGYPKPASMSFADGIQRTVESLWVMNSTWVALYGAEDFAVRIAGFDAMGEPTGEPKEVDLTGLTQWTRVSLSELGKVNRIEFTIDCPDPIAPTYLCIDDVKIIVE